MDRGRCAKKHPHAVALDRPGMLQSLAGPPAMVELQQVPALAAINIRRTVYMYEFCIDLQLCD